MMKRITIIDKLILFIFWVIWAIRLPIFFISGLILLSYFDKTEILSHSIKLVFIVGLPLVLLFMIGGTYKFLFTRMANILKDEIIASEMFEKILTDDKEGYHLQLKNSFWIHSDYNVFEIYVDCFGQQYKFYLFLFSSVNKITEYAKRRRYAYRNQ